MEQADAEEQRRIERIRSLMEKDFAAEQEAFRVQALVGNTFEASIRDLPAPAAQATVLAVDSGMVLLQYADPQQSRYWVPLSGIQWLKVLR